MINIKKKGLLMLIIFLYLVCLIYLMTSNVSATEHGQAAMPPSGERFRTSFYCAECHEDRYKEWSSTMHALAVSDPIFRSAYMKAILFESSNREYCLKCHSPIIKTTKDFNLTKSISVEGVTCNFCHNVEKVDIGNNSYTLNNNGTMVGPYKDSFSAKHPSNYSELLTKSEFCAGCHEFSLNGIPISETYSEWKEGPYSKEGVQCQDCHMAVTPGYSSNGIEREKVYKHFWYGGHTGQFLERAFDVEYQINKEGKKANIVLNITNKGVGHKIPSGFPSRQVVLGLVVTDDNNKEIYNDKKIYTKTLVDQYGNDVQDFWRASSITSDNRIKPRESRIETFEFDIPDGTNKMEVHITLDYHLEAEIIQKETINVELINKKDIISLDSLSKDMSSDNLSKEKKTPGFEWIGYAIAIIIVSGYIRKYR